MQILGFSGKIGSGKTAAARYVEEKVCPTYMPGWSQHGFFDEAKYWFKLGMGLPFECDLSDQEVKNRVLPNGLTIREALQKFGTDYCRSLHPDWWVNAWKGKLDEMALTGPSTIDLGLVTVPDVRFPNELRAIQERGGHVIRLLRAPRPEDNHETETALDEAEKRTIGYPNGYYGALKGELFDAAIDNREMSIEAMQEAVWGLVSERGWV